MREGVLQHEFEAMDLAYEVLINCECRACTPDASHPHTDGNPGTRTTCGGDSYDAVSHLLTVPMLVRLCACCGSRCLACGPASLTHDDACGGCFRPQMILCPLSQEAQPLRFHISREQPTLASQHASGNLHWSPPKPASHHIGSRDGAAGGGAEPHTPRTPLHGAHPSHGNRVGLRLATPIGAGAGAGAGDDGATPTPHRTPRLRKAVPNQKMFVQFETSMGYKVVDADPQDMESATWATISVTMRRVFLYCNGLATAIDEGVAVLEVQLSPYYRGALRFGWAGNTSWYQRLTLARAERFANAPTSGGSFHRRSHSTPQHWGASLLANIAKQDTPTGSREPQSGAVPEPSTAPSSMAPPVPPVQRGAAAPVTAPVPPVPAAAAAAAPTAAPAAAPAVAIAADVVLRRRVKLRGDSVSSAVSSGSDGQLALSPSERPQRDLPPPAPTDAHHTRRGSGFAVDALEGVGSDTAANDAIAREASGRGVSDGGASAVSAATIEDGRRHGTMDDAESQRGSARSLRKGGASIHGSEAALGGVLAGSVGSPSAAADAALLMQNPLASVRPAASAAAPASSGASMARQPGNAARPRSPMGPASARPEAHSNTRRAHGVRRSHPSPAAGAGSTRPDHVGAVDAAARGSAVGQQRPSHASRQGRDSGHHGSGGSGENRSHHGRARSDNGPLTANPRAGNARRHRASHSQGGPRRSRRSARRRWKRQPGDEEEEVVV